MSASANPFLDPAPSEVHLKDSPLIRVIAQVQFPTQLGLVERSTVSGIQKVLAGRFPVLEEQTLKNFIFELSLGEQEGKFTPQNLPQPQWRFQDPHRSTVLVINSTSITLETTRYESRRAFFDTFRACLEAIHGQARFSLANRLGVRYVDQVAGARVKDMVAMINPTLHGISNSPFPVEAQADMHDFLVATPNENASLHVRHGFLPPHGTIDPGVLSPQPSASWVLDLDMFRQGEIAFDPVALSVDALNFSQRIYAVFRWIVNSDFLKQFGGRP